MEGIKVIESKYKILNGYGGYFRVQNENGIGIIDRDGRMIVMPSYNIEDVRITPEDGPVEAFIRIRRVDYADTDHVYDLIAPDGTILQLDCYGECVGVREGIAIVKNHALYGYDLQGNKLFEIINCAQALTPSYYALFHDGMLRVCNELGFYHYYVNAKGEKKTKAFMHAGEFHQGRAVVSKEKMLGLMRNRYGCIDQNGYWVVRPKYDYMDDYRNSRALVKLNGKYGYVDQNGIVKVPLEWDTANNFDEQKLAFVRSESPVRACLIDRMGKAQLMLPADCTHARSFSEEFLAATRGALWGFIDREGSWAIAPIYEQVGDFCNGMAPVCYDGIWSFIDTNGAEVLSVEGRLRIVGKGLAHTDHAVYDYGYQPTK